MCSSNPHPFIITFFFLHSGCHAKKSFADCGAEAVEMFTQSKVLKDIFVGIVNRLKSAIDIAQEDYLCGVLVHAGHNHMHA